MKKVILFCLCFALLLCGCEKEYETSSGVGESYASKYLEYEAATECSVTLAGEQRTLKIGQKIGGFTLTKLYLKAENDGLRASFSCDLSVSGTLSYKNGGVYSELLRFTAANPDAFPKVAGAEYPKWFVILENNDPFYILKSDKEQSIKKDAEIRISAFHVHKSPENTICYIEIK